MLNAHGQQAIGLDFARLAVFIQRPHLHLCGAFHAVIDAGNGQAAFLALDALLAGPQQLGVDERDGLVAFFGHVNDDDALMHINLRGGQADALGLVHGFEHVGHQGADAAIHRLHGLRHFLQARIGKVKNGKKRHEA